MKHLSVTYLPKKGGARFHNVESYRVSCENNHIEAFKTLKAAEEVGLDIDEFTHVLLSHLGDTRKEVVVKVHDSRSRFIRHELNILRILKGFRNTVALLCDFKCNDDKQRWLKNIKRSTTLCKLNGKDSLHYFVMEYIPNGDLVDFIKEISFIYQQDTKQGLKLLQSLFLQIALAIMHMGTVYKVYHGDLNSGNILIYKTSKKSVKYNVFDKEYMVNTHGFYPVFIDFGRAGTYDMRSKNKSPIKDDICIVGNVIVSWINDQELSKKFNAILDKLEYGKNKDFDYVINVIKCLEAA